MLKKISSVIAENDLDLSNLVNMNVYITDSSYLADVRATFTEILGEIKPTMTLVVVSELINYQFKVEIDVFCTLGTEHIFHESRLTN
ncbi:Rid family hydrolase [Metasolibacillus sp.]|uniref:RidA family protein n=1 Tax=Metasolibacillus sp. TaxID=2703680 RepID=UPI003413D6A2